MSISAGVNQRGGSLLSFGSFVEKQTLGLSSSCLARWLRLKPLPQLFDNLPQINPGGLFPKRNLQSLPLSGLDDGFDFCVYESAACQLYFYAVANFVIAHAGPSCLHLIRPRLFLRVFSALLTRLLVLSLRGDYPRCFLVA